MQSHIQKLTSSKRAFTLIELLVVIAIIAILAAILFPVFARARVIARRASWQSNLKQMGLGIMQYVQDFDEYYPPGRNCGGASTAGACPGVTFSGPFATNRGMWKVFTYPYVKSFQIYNCPSGRGQLEGTYTIGGQSYTFPETYAYGMNTNVLTNVTDGIGPFSAAQVGNSSLMVLGGDASFSIWDNVARVVNSTTITPVNHDNRVPDLQYTRHFEGSNILYVDGHVKFQNQKQMGPMVSGTPNDLQWGLAFVPTDARLK